MYHHVYKLHPKWADKITGMLLALGADQVWPLLKSTELLNCRVNEAVLLLNAALPAPPPGLCITAAPPPGLCIFADRNAVCSLCGRAQLLHVLACIRCTWCNRDICEWHGERIPGKKVGDMPRWQCNHLDPACWKLWWESGRS